MNYEKFKRSDRPDRFRSLTTDNCQLSNDFLSIVGEKFFNDYLWIDTKRLPMDRHKKVSDFCKMKFVHVHFAAD